MNYIMTHSLHGRAGHQLAEWNTSLLLAELFQLQHVGIPFNHGWEDQLRFNEDAVKVADVRPAKTIMLPRFDRANPASIEHILCTGENNVLFILDENQNLLDHWPCESALKEKWRNSPCNLPWNGRNKIGVHIRRGDVNADKYPNRWVSFETYAQIISSAIDRFPNYEVHVFSEGVPEDFILLKEFSPVFHLNESEFATFNKMTKCDTLITGKSGYSYFAAILSEGIIYAIPFWHSYPDNERIVKL